MSTIPCHSQLLTLLSLDSINSPAFQFPVLNDFSHQLVSNKALRVHLGSQHPSIWVLLQELWNKLGSTQSPGSHVDLQLVIVLARFTRNLVADVPFNQKNAFPLEPRIRQLIYLHTAWTEHNAEFTFLTTRMLTQTLSNLVTGNQDLLDHFWALHMRIPEEQSVLIRLLGLPDLPSVISVLVLIMNCIYDSRERGHALIATAIGVRVCVSILDRLEGLLDHSELGDEGKVFELGCVLFSNLFRFGLFPELYNRTSLQDEHVSPTQRILLKLLDSFLQPASSFRGADDDNFRYLTGFLVSEFFSQAENVQHTVRHATGMSSSDQDYTTDVLGVGGAAQQAADGALDVRLPGVCAALILLSTSLSSILLSERETRANESGAGPDPNLVMLTLPCRDATAGSANTAGTGFIECLIETLRLLNIYLPPINHGQTRSSFPGDRVAVPDRPMMTGFPYLKRDLVRLLGILCHDSKPIQDRVRCCGGIPIVLNLCVIDERNPYLREHAVFTLRSILHNSPENQAVVDSFRADEHVVRETTVM